jgi:hypothetical protein
MRRRAFEVVVCLTQPTLLLILEIAKRNGEEQKKMTYHFGQQSKKTLRVRRWFTAALVIGCAYGAATNAAAQTMTNPATPAIITPPAGNSAFLLGHAVGTQGYVCLPTSEGASWTVNSARPDANPNEFAPDPLPFGSPTWQSSFDNSKVWAQALHSIPAGSDASCPNDGAITCLLLQSIGSQQGSAGGRVMTATTYIQRLNTKGGSAPANGCSTSTDVGKQTLVPYTADYYFFLAVK